MYQDDLQIWCIAIRGGVQCGYFYYLLEINPLTGRHHQIRVQLGAINSPIKGDVKYGAKRSNPDGSICLHARYLTFTHPTTKEEISVTAPVPSDRLWQEISRGL